MRWEHLIWLDNVKPIAKELQWFPHIVVCRSYKEAVKAINAIASSPHEKIFISFDYHLGEKRTGYDFAKYIVNRSLPIDGFDCHCANKAGRKKIEDLLICHNYTCWSKK